MNASSSFRPALELTAIPRPSEADRGNLFIRLTPRTAWRLASLLFASSPDEAPTDFDVSQEVPDVDFLPLEIVINRKLPGDAAKEEEDDEGNIIFYGSYNGGAPSSATGFHNSDDIIELPLDLHPSLLSVFNSTSAPVVVSVRPISNAPIAERVTFEPLTISDWEMIEMEAEMLEDGGLLNQITVVSPGQVFPLRFGGNMGSLESAAWIRVVEEDFGISSNQKIDSCFSDESDASVSSDSEFDSTTDSSDDEDSSFEGDNAAHRHKCVRLMAETEVAVIPKLRTQKEDVGNEETKEHSNDEPIYCPSDPLRVQLNSLDISLSGPMAEDSPSLPQPPVGFVFVHPSTLMRIPGYQQCSESTYQSDGSSVLEKLPPMVVTIQKVSSPHARSSSRYNREQQRGTGNDVAVAIIQSSDCVHVGHIGMHSLLRYQLDAIPFADWVTIQVWSESHIMSSITSVRKGFQKIVVSKTCIAEERSLQAWNSPDDHSTFPASSKFMCDCCRKNNDYDGKDDRLSPLAFSAKDDICKPTPIFCSGSLIPVEFLQNLGLDGLEQFHHETIVVKIQPVKAPLHDSVKSGCLPGNTSNLVPIVTERDLKDLFMRGGKIEEAGNVKLSEARNVSSIMQISKESTIGFTSAIQSIMQSVRMIALYTPIPENSYTCALQPMPNHAIMVTGEEGSGKTHLSLTSVSQLAISDMFATVYLDCKKLQAASTNIQNILEEVQASFQEAVRKQPSVLILDDLDALIPNVESSGGDGEGSIQHHQLNPALVIQVKIIVDHLLLQSQYCRRSFQHKCSIKSAGVVLICTCSDSDSLSTRYQESGVFHSLVEVPSLDSSQRAQFIHNNMFGDGQTASNHRIPHAISRLGKDTDGFRPKDLKIIAMRIVHLDCLRHFPSQSSEPKCGSIILDEQSVLQTLEEDITSIIDNYSPLSQQLVDIDHNLSSVDWTSVGGLFEAKQSLHDIIIHPMKFKSVYDNAPMALPSGVLVYGPPGNGKSFIVPLLAKRSKLNLITCRGPELLDRYIGASEAKVRQLFARAIAAAPAMIFFDEFDSLAPQRGSDHTGVTDRVVNQLLTLLDGAERSKKASHIFVVAATSRPDKIDKALLRPGRLEKHIYVGYPQSLLEWNSLFSSLLDTRDIDEEVCQLQQDGDLFGSFCKDLSYARDFSAADMKAVLDTAHLLCVHEILDSQRDDGPCHTATLGKCHILEAFRRTKPSLLPKDRQVLGTIYATFGNNQQKESSGNQNGRTLKTSLR